MGNKIAFFLPTRKGSERVRNKNTRPFAGIEGGLIKKQQKKKKKQKKTQQTTTKKKKTQ